MPMIRIQIGLDGKQRAQLIKEVRAMGISLEEFVRRAVRDRLTLQADARWMRYAALIETGDLRSSETIDEIVYGVK
jgi:hypothetical protein